MNVLYTYMSCNFNVCFQIVQRKAKVKFLLTGFLDLKNVYFDTTFVFVYVGLK